MLQLQRHRLDHTETPQRQQSCESSCISKADCRKKRFFARGGVKLALLQLLSCEPMHGYQMMKALEEQSLGLYTPSAGSIYPALQLLKKNGLVTVQMGENGKKIYLITEAGRTALPHIPETLMPSAAELSRDIEEAGLRQSEKTRRELGLSNESFTWLKLATKAERDASTSEDRSTRLRELLDEQQRQLRAFMAGSI